MGEGLAREPLPEGVQVIPLRVIPDDRGAVLHMLRADARILRQFGEVYFSEVGSGAVKAWKRHRRMTQHLAVPIGRVKFVIHDDREQSPTQGHTTEVILGRPDAYGLLVVPPSVWYGFKGIATGTSLIVNCTDLPHDPAEVERAEVCPGLPGYTW